MWEKDAQSAGFHKIFNKSFIAMKQVQDIYVFLNVRISDKPFLFCVQNMNNAHYKKEESVLLNSLHHHCPLACWVHLDVSVCVFCSHLLMASRRLRRRSLLLISLNRQRKEKQMQALNCSFLLSTLLQFTPPLPKKKKKKQSLTWPRYHAHSKLLLRNSQELWTVLTTL